jgi:hypothetical protein
MRSRRTFIKKGTVLGAIGVITPSFIFGAINLQSFHFQKYSAELSLVEHSFPSSLRPVFLEKYVDFKQLNYSFSDSTILFHKEQNVAVVPIELKINGKRLDHQILIFNKDHMEWTYVTSFNQHEIHGLNHLQQQLRHGSNFTHNWLPTKTMMIEDQIAYANDQMCFVPKVSLSNNHVHTEIKYKLAHSSTFSIFKNTKNI